MKGLGRDFYVEFNPTGPVQFMGKGLIWKGLSMVFNAVIVNV